MNGCASLSDLFMEQCITEVKVYWNDVFDIFMMHKMSR